jgi:hypothetical protein
MSTNLTTESDRHATATVWQARFDTSIDSTGRTSDRIVEEPMATEYRWNGEKDATGVISWLSHTIRLPSLDEVRKAPLSCGYHFALVISPTCPGGGAMEFR